jgi:NAD+ synthase
VRKLKLYGDDFMTETEKLGFPEYLEFDTEKTRKEIVEFVRNQVKNFKKDCVVVGLSGGLDSSTLHTCVLKH